jgi:hypothetical protein
VFHEVLIFFAVGFEFGFCDLDYFGENAAFDRSVFHAIDILDDLV